MAQQLSKFTDQLGTAAEPLHIHGLSQFTIQTDHKPLIPILNNKMLVDMSPRIQRMKMTVLPYTFTAEHVEGATLKDADASFRSSDHQ